MSTKPILTIATFIAAFTFFTSCGKYEYGPEFTLLTKKARLTGEWDTIEYESSDGIITADNSSRTIKFDKSGKVTLNEVGFSISGKWEFSSNKEKIIINSDFFDGELIILRLTNKELWTKDLNGGISRSEKI